MYKNYEVERIGEKLVVVAPLPEQKMRKIPARDGYPAFEVWTSADYDPGIARTYAPLRDHPDLFLKFARLAEKKHITIDDMLEWAQKYGLLGGESIDRVEH